MASDGFRISLRGNVEEWLNSNGKLPDIRQDALRENRLFAIPFHPSPLNAVEEAIALEAATMLSFVECGVPIDKYFEGVPFVTLSENSSDRISSAQYPIETRAKTASLLATKELKKEGGSLPVSFSHGGYGSALAYVDTLRSRILKALRLMGLENRWPLIRIMPSLNKVPTAESGLFLIDDEVLILDGSYSTSLSPSLLVLASVLFALLKKVSNRVPDSFAILRVNHGIIYRAEYASLSQRDVFLGEMFCKDNDRQWKARDNVLVERSIEREGNKPSFGFEESGFPSTTPSGEGKKPDPATSEDPRFPGVSLGDPKEAPKQKKYPGEGVDLEINMIDSMSYAEFRAENMFALSSSHGAYLRNFMFLREIVITNHEDSPTGELLLKFETSLPWFRVSDMRIESLPKDSRRKMSGNALLQVEEREFYSLNSPIACAVRAMLEDKDGRILKEWSGSIKLVPLRQCTESHADLAPYLLSEYCVTDFPEMETLYQKAILENEGRPLVGYQNESIEEMLGEIDCLYRAIHKWGVSYSNPPQSTGLFQNVLLPMDVLRKHSGTCLDLAILFCSALIRAGYNPILVLVDGHAFAGSFLDESAFFNSFVSTSPAEVENMLRSPERPLVLFECTTATNDSSAPFSTAQKIASDRVRGYRGARFSATSVSQCQSAFFPPIPLPNEAGGVDFELPIRSLDPSLIHLDDALPSRTIDGEGEKSRFDIWTRKLLDLSRRNNLINFRTGDGKRSNYASFRGLRANEVYEFIRERSEIELKFYSDGITGERVLSGLADMEDPTIERQRALDGKGKGFLLLNGNPDVMKELIRNNRAYEEETGCRTLYMAFGLLECFDAGERIQGPFLLLPIRIQQVRYENTFRMSYDFDEIMLNETILEYLRVKYDADYTDLYGFTSDISFEEARASLNRIKTDRDVRVSEDYTFIANFRSNHYVMWKELYEKRDIIGEQPIVRSLVANSAMVSPLSVTEGKGADDIDNPEEFSAPLPYDSTQLKAIVEAAAGSSFVLDGPPGTGKSQTIVNMIMNAMFHGKRVLFVAEKQAALEVVRERLASLKFMDEKGMDAFALQLYSSKTDKKTVFKQLNDVMELSRQIADIDDTEVFKGLGESREELKEELKELHDHHGLCLSLYEALVLRQESLEAKGLYSIDRKRATELTPEKEDEVARLIQNIMKVASKIPGDYQKPLLRFRFSRISNEDREAFASELARFKECKESICRILKDALEGIGAVCDESEWPAFAGSFMETADKILSGSVLPDFLEGIPEFERDEESSLFFERLLELSSKTPFLMEWLRLDGIDQLSIPQLQEAYQKGEKGFLSFLHKNDAAKLMRPYLVGGTLPNREETARIINALVGARNAWSAIEPYAKSYSPFARGGISFGMSGGEAAEAKARFYETKDAYLKIRSEKGARACFGIYRKEGRAALLDALDIIKEANAQLGDLTLTCDAFMTKFPYFPFGDSGQLSGWMEDVLHVLSSEIGTELLDAVARVNAIGEELEDLGFGDLREMVSKGEIPVSKMLLAYRHALATAVMNAQMDLSRWNQQFDPSLYESTVERFQELLLVYPKIAIARTVQRITSRFLTKDAMSIVMAETPIGELKKLARNGGRGVTVRKALQKYGEYFSRYFPCFLMTPTSVAQYLSLGGEKFDIVIFDEASQVPTAEAVGAIARGKALIVSGDPKQMPPSNYFALGLDEDELDPSLTDSDSLLEDCLSIDMPRLPLAFHYRSRHESLIGFSNDNFYEGGLYTFPSTDSGTPHVFFKHIALPAEKSNSDLTEYELNEITNFLERLLLDKANYGKTFGIIVFNDNQRKALVKKLDAYFGKHADFAERAGWFSEDLDKRMFVKNIDNVQGDERDVIVLCVSFATKNGIARLGGPLIQEKGERRLNVAVSRSRERMYVLSTLTSSSIQTEGRKNSGGMKLKEFLRYAEGCSQPVSTRKANPSIIAKEIGKGLEDAGFEVDYGVGHSTFKIDIAVKKKGSKDYILGILLDQTGLNDNISARDRFFVEPTVLKGLHWKVTRVYVQSYSRTPRMVMQQLVNLAQEIEKEDTRSQVDVEPIPLVPASSGYEDVFENVTFPVPPNPVNFMEGYVDQRFLEYLKSLIAAGAPYSYEALKAKVRDALGLGRIGSRIEVTINRYLRKLNAVRKVEGDGLVFYALPDTPDVARVKRWPGKQIRDYSDEELALLMAKIAKDALGLGKENLFRLAADKLGVQRLTEFAHGRFVSAFGYGLEHGLIDRKSVAD